MFPFESTSVPQWKVQVTNQDGLPIKKLIVRQTWNNYTLSGETDVKEEDLETDDTGVVIFRERRDRESLLFRFAFYLWNFVKIFIRHSSVGVHAMVFSPEYPASALSYDGSSAPPSVLVIEQ
jgi:hypothetical protein